MSFRTLRAVISSFLCIAYFTYTLSTIVFWHTHVYKGYIVAHSHPITAGDNQEKSNEHNHTEAQLAVLAQLANISSTVDDFTPTLEPLLHFTGHQIISVNSQGFESLHLSRHKQLRAPPACFA